MYNQVKLKELLEEEKKRYEDKIEQLEAELRGLPKGHLAFRNNSYYQVIYDGGLRTQKTICRADPDRDKLIQNLQKKRYILKVLPIIKENLKACNKFLDKFCIYDIEEIRRQMPNFYKAYRSKDLLLKGDNYMANWENVNYEKNTLYEDSLICKSEKGLLVRSKSESIIATKLEQLGLMFQYDSIVRFGDDICSPDFKIMHPRHRRIIYWEHFGMMDNLEYVKKTMWKINLYGDNGIYIGDNLIVTWEMKNKPLQYEQINERIEKQLLN